MLTAGWRKGDVGIPTGACCRVLSRDGQIWTRMKAGLKETGKPGGRWGR